MNKKFLKYLPTVLLFISIMLLSWYGRSIQKMLRANLGYEGLLIFVCVSFLIFVFLGIKIFSLRAGYIRWMLLLYPLGIWYLSANPEEAVHLVEYGTFALSLSWMFGPEISLKKNMLFSFLGTVFVGFLDEAFQGINSTRVFDLRDFLINTIGAAIAVSLFELRN